IDAILQKGEDELFLGILESLGRHPHPAGHDTSVRTPRGAVNEGPIASAPPCLQGTRAFAPFTANSLSSKVLWGTRLPLDSRLSSSRPMPTEGPKFSSLPNVRCSPIRLRDRTRTQFSNVPAGARQVWPTSVIW